MSIDLRIAWIKILFSTAVIMLCAACADDGGVTDETAQSGSAAAEAGESPVIGGCAVFPPDNPWNTPVDTMPLDGNSRSIIERIGGGAALHADFGTEWMGAPNGIPYVVVPRNQSTVRPTFEYDDESDHGDYPVPPDAPIEGGPQSDGDRHVLVLQSGACRLFELFDAWPRPGGGWHAGSGAIFDLSSNELRPDTWTSADAAGLPILPGLVKYDEVATGTVRHALRVTVSRTRSAFIHPATHWASASGDSDLPPMGMRMRLKADFDVSGFPQEAQVIIETLKRYGMFVADNGGDWFISGAPDPRWSDDNLHTLRGVHGYDFEVVRMGRVYTPADF